MELRSLVHEFVLISVIHRCHITKTAAAAGLYFGQPSILSFVTENDGCTQKDVAKALHISPPSAATSLKRMEKAGLITRTADASDCRKNHLSITLKGTHALEQFNKICDTTDKAMFKDFTTNELDTLHSLLSRLHKNLDSESFTPEEIESLLIKNTQGEKSDD